MPSAGRMLSCRLFSTSNYCRTIVTPVNASYRKLILLLFFSTGCVGTTHRVNRWPFCLLATSCWWRWPQTRRTTIPASEHKSRKSNVEVKVGSFLWQAALEVFKICANANRNIFYRYIMWWSAVRWKGKLLFPQLPKLLSSSDFMSVVDRGETSALNQQYEMFHTILFCSSEGQRVIYLFFYSSLRSLLVKRWSWRSKGSSCLSLGRKTARTAAKTMCQSMKRSESVLAYLKNHIGLP